MKALIAVLLLTTSLPAIAEDACRAQIPSSLTAAAQKAFPTFRLPVVTDSQAADVQQNLKEKGSSCLGVAEADFDGNGTKDFVIGLTALKGTRYVVVVALLRKNKWQFHKLDEQLDGRSSLYVSAEKPGTYLRTEALDGPLEPGEVSKLTCHNPVAVFGGIESSGVAYCYKRGKWPHVWISD